MQKNCAAKGSLAEGVTQASVLLQKSMKFVKHCAIIKSNKEYCRSEIQLGVQIFLVTISQIEKTSRRGTSHEEVHVRAIPV